MGSLVSSGPVSTSNSDQELDELEDQELIQEWFNKIWNHFKTPGVKRSLRAVDGRCFYRLNRNPKGKVRCAIGVLIPDDKYDTGLDTCSNLAQVIHLILNAKKPISHNSRIYQFCYYMRDCHDNAKNKADMLKQFKERVARKFNLTIPG